MAIKFVIDVSQERANERVLPLDQQVLGNFTEEEREMMRQQQRMAQALDGENNAQNNQQNAEGGAAQAENAGEVEKLNKIAQSMNGQLYMNYDMVLHHAQETRKSANRMSGHSDDYDKYHEEVTNYQINFLAIDIINLLKTNGDNSEELQALDNEAQAVYEECRDWKDDALIQISCATVSSVTGGNAVSVFIPFEKGEKVKNILNKIENYIDKKIDEIVKTNPKINEKDLLKEVPTKDDMTYLYLNKIKKQFELKKNNKDLFYAIENNVYSRNAMMASDVMKDMLPDDPAHPGVTNNENDPAMSQMRIDKVYNTYTLVPLPQYYSLLTDMGILQSQVEKTHKTFSDKAKAEYDKAIKDGKNAEEATAIARANTNEEKEAYNAARKKLIEKGAVLDNLFQKISSNTKFAIDNFILQGTGNGVDSLDESMKDDPEANTGAYGTILRSVHNEHKAITQLVLNGWDIHQANVIYNTYAFLQKQCNIWNNQYNIGQIQMPENFSINTAQSRLNTALDSVKKLMKTVVHNTETMSFAADPVITDLQRASEALGKEDIIFEATNINNEPLNKHMFELEASLKRQLSPLEDDLIKETSNLNELYKNETEKNKYTEEKKNLDRTKALERKKVIIENYKKIIIQENINNIINDAQPVNQENLANQANHEVHEDNIDNNLNINAFVEDHVNRADAIENEPEEELNQPQHEEINNQQELPNGEKAEEIKEPELEITEEEAALYYKEINELTRTYIKEHPFDIAMIGFGAKSDVDKIETYHATKMIGDNPVFLNDPKKKAVFDENLRTFEDSLSNIKLSSGENILKKYNNGYLKMLSNPGYEELNATLMRYRGIVLEELKNIENDLPAVKDAVKDKIVNARTIELAFEEIKRSGNKANINECEKLYINTVRGMKGSNVTPEITIAKLFDEIHPYLEEITENRITELTHHNERAELDRAREEAARRAEEARLARQARERALQNARNAIIDEDIIDNAKRTTAARRKVLAKRENEEVFQGYLRNESVFKKVRGVLLDDDINKIRTVNPLANPGGRMVRYTPRTSLMEQLNTLDISKATTFLNDIMLRIGDYLTPEQKKQITDAFTNIHNALYYNGNPVLDGNKGSMIAADSIEWSVVPAGIERELEEFKKTFKPIVKGLDEYLAKQKTYGKDPLANFYRDYYFGLLNGESLIAFTETDGVMEGVFQNLQGGITQTNSSGKLDFNKMRKDFHNFPILEAASNALAIHRFLDTESLSIEDGEAMESNNALKVLEYSKELKKNFEDMDSFPHEEYVKLAKAGLVQAGQEQQFKLGPGRGFQAAYDENNDRISALEHKWLVRDMPFISQAGRLARVFKNKLKNDTKLTVVQKAEMKNYIDYYNNEILKNSEPMTSGRRNRLMLGLSTRLYVISYPAVQIGIQTFSDGKYVNSGDKRTYDRNIAASVVALLNQFNRTAKRELSNCEQQTMLCGNGNMTSLLKAMKDRWDGMPAEPVWHKSVFTKTPENDPFTNMKFKYELFMSRYQAKAAINADLLGHPEKDPELVELAKQMGEAAENYIKAKDIQKKVDLKKKIHEKRKFNKENRSDYGQYRYELGEYLATAAGMVIGFSKNDELLKKAKPVADEVKVNVNKAKTDDDLVKKTKVQQPAGIGRH